MSETPVETTDRAVPYPDLEIDRINGGAWTSVSAPLQAHSETLQTARLAQQALYDAAQGGHWDDETGMVVEGTRDGAALAAIEADVAPRANRQYGVHVAPDATAGVPEETPVVPEG